MKKWYLQIVILVSITALFCVSYQIERSQFLELFLLYAVLFICFIRLVKQDLKFGQFLLIGILFRLTLLLATPSLSNDFYRFIWDGKLSAMGINPYLIMPKDFMLTETANGIDMIPELFEKMNSPDHYTIYPPINLLFFIVGAFIFPANIFGNVLFMRVLIILADIGVVYLGGKILQQLKMDSRIMWLYFLNPFVILEFTGSLHFEGVMLFFILWAVWLLLNNKWIVASFIFALAASVKVVPLMLLPLFFQKLGFKRFILFGTLTMSFFVLFFVPLIDPKMWHKSAESYLLYFQVFEINASFYYLIRAIGFYLVGYNIIHIAGPVLAGISLIIILLISFHRKNKHWEGFFESAMMIFCIYYFLSAIVHPWYIAIPLVFSLFTRYRFVLAWSFLIIVSYYIYHTNPPKENMWILFWEYFILFGLLILEYSGMDFAKIMQKNPK